MKYKNFCLVIFLSLFVSNIYAHPYPDFNTKVTTMIKTSLPEATVGVILQDAVTGKILYDYHGSKHFLPASTTKLFTAAAALKELGPSYCYETALYSNKAGDVAIKFSGDPSLKLANLYSLLKKLQEAHLTTINDLWIDDTLFDGPMLGHGWTWDSTSWYHAAPVSAIIIERNQFGITLYPATELGGEVKAKLDTNYPGAKTRKLKTHLRGVTQNDSENLCQIMADVDERNNVELGGCWPIGSEPVHLRLAVRNPRLQAQQLILELLEQLQVKVKGKIKFAKVPENHSKLAHHDSEPLHILLNAILGDSNNLYAESLTKTLGAKKYGNGSFKTGAMAVQQILSQFTGIDFAQTRLLDGSGESRYNLLTPLHLSRLLYTMEHEKGLGPYFRDALALSGVNGTLQLRFASFDAKASIQAKTGTLNGVSALSGYLTTRSNRQLIVTIMINHAMGTGAVLKQFENDLCYFLVNQL
jgi:D-alanyl-D-alanine carboxypeptidase/D-alanyl-D-alanine-endopeptidase (penicillin-binding protein 4)